MHDTNEGHERPDDDSPHYRTVEFADGVVIYDYYSGRRWLHANNPVSLEEMR